MMKDNKWPDSHLTTRYSAIAPVKSEALELANAWLAEKGLRPVRSILEYDHPRGIRVEVHGVPVAADDDG